MEQSDKIATLRAQIRTKRNEAFAAELDCIGYIQQAKMLAMVDAYDIVLGLIRKVSI
ncbi:hypothetical protein ES703_60425 [subsurface metagenome]